MDCRKADEELYKSQVFTEILEKFDRGLLTYTGKNGVEVKVTSSKQAWAMAHAMSTKAAKRNFH